MFRLYLSYYSCTLNNSILVEDVNANPVSVIREKFFAMPVFLLVSNEAKFEGQVPDEGAHGTFSNIDRHDSS